MTFVSGFRGAHFAKSAEEWPYAWLAHRLRVSFQERSGGTEVALRSFLLDTKPRLDLESPRRRFWAPATFIVPPLEVTQ